MPRERSTHLLLDTSAVVHQFHGHTLQRAAFREIVKDAKVLTPVFVRMEYLRGIILNLIRCGALSESRSRFGTHSSTGRRKFAKSEN